MSVEPWVGKQCEQKPTAQLMNAVMTPLARPLAVVIVGSPVNGALQNRNGLRCPSEKFKTMPTMTSGDFRQSVHNAVGFDLLNELIMKMPETFKDAATV